jgi:hypothetical protein
MFVCLFACLPFYLSVNMSICLLPVGGSVVCLSVFLYACLSVCLSVCFSTVSRTFLNVKYFHMITDYLDRKLSVIDGKFETQYNIILRVVMLSVFYIEMNVFYVEMNL